MDRNTLINPHLHNTLMMMLNSTVVNFVLITITIAIVVRVT